MKKKKKLAHSKVLTQYDISDESCYLLLATNSSSIGNTIFFLRAFLHKHALQQ